MTTCTHNCLLLTDMLMNEDLEQIVTPVNVALFEQLLVESGYNTNETTYLVNGFTNGFDLEYQGPRDRADVSHNLPFREVGTPHDLWSKMAKEVNMKRFAGRFNKIPFNHYIQSPVGLLPKAGGQTHLIFHLSYEFKKSGHKSELLDSAKQMHS